jgi:hypothetical protein
MTVRYIRITAMPAGGAPDWVRQRWVGLELPLVLHQDKGRHFLTHSVTEKPGFFASLWRILTGKSGKQEGFAVATMAAIAVLEQSSPDAAQWWREHAPQLIKPGHHFVFRTDCCHLLEEKKAV